jgi:hypothetical protein
MNPEFLRNLWLELTPWRMAAMAGILALIFAATALTGGDILYRTAVFLYYAIVVVWGTRNAALSVVGEIRNRTWDSQRLSALGPGQMMWGKLFGATAYNWFGGIVCLAVILVFVSETRGTGEATASLVYYLAVGVISHAAALLASLIAVGRNRSPSRLDVFFHQVVGLFAAVWVYTVWSMTKPTVFWTQSPFAAASFDWWGVAVNGSTFMLLSLSIFAAWLLVGCYRTMRIELQMRNGPWVWLGFLVFSGFYCAGFESGNFSVASAPMGEFSLRLAQAGVMFLFLSYVMAFLEPKNSVRYRWMAGELSARRYGKVLGALQGWMTSALAALAVGIVLLAALGHGGAWQVAALVAAVLGFFVRDMAAIVLVGSLSPRKSDLAVLAALCVPYIVLPLLLRGLGGAALLVLCYPRFGSEPLWLSPAVAVCEAVLAAVCAVLFLVPRVSPTAKKA